MTSRTSPDKNSGALFSPDRKYRYKLWRVWDEDTPPACFILLNPSTADENKDDPTVARCTVRARRMGFGGIYVANIFSFRSTDPAALYSESDPMGPGNNYHIARAAEDAGIIVCGWGTHGSHMGRGFEVMSMLKSVLLTKSLHHLGLTKNGQPRHPLYVSYMVQPQRWG